MNFAFATVEFVYVVSLATFVVGDLLVGALALPLVFKIIPDRALAGAVASAILARFSLVKWVCLALLAVCATVRYFRWEGPAWPIFTRHAALGVLALCFLCGYFLLSPRIEALRPAMAAEPTQAVRAEFARLHGAAVSVGMVGAVSGLVALYFS